MAKKKSLSKVINCTGNEHLSNCRVGVSVRNDNLGLYVSGSESFPWAHLSLKQAKSLRSFIDKAITEIEHRLT